MSRPWVPVIMGLVFACFAVGTAQAQGRDYADPDGDFALRPPEGWQVARSAIGSAGWATTFSRGTAHIAVLSFRSATDLTPAMLDDTGGALMNASIEEIAMHGTIFSKIVKKAPAQVSGASATAIRCDLEFTSEEGGSARLKGCMLALLGRRVAVLTAISAPATDLASYGAAEAALRTLALESRVPAGQSVAAKAAAPSGGSPSGSKGFAGLATKFQGNLKRETRNEIIAAGNPPLTYGSVASFAELMGECFDIQLTEAEFEATRQRFIEYYQKQDAEGKAMLAEGWEKILQQIRGLQGQERAAAVEDVRKVLVDRFSTGASAGIGWAVLMNEAIAKRSQTVARASGGKPGFAKDQRFDNDFSQADLDAALEMLYFMWVASGRNAALVTADTVNQVRTQLVVGYATFPPDLQYVLANAQQIYAGLRAQWENGGMAQRLQMSAVFGQQLDALGFTVPSPRGNGGRSGSAWSDWDTKSHANFAGEMVVGLAGSSYKSAW